MLHPPPGGLCTRPRTWGEALGREGASPRVSGLPPRQHLPGPKGRARDSPILTLGPTRVQVWVPEELVRAEGTSSAGPRPLPHVP